MVNFVQSLQSEIDALEDSLRTSPDPRVVKLQELKKVLALYGGEMSVATAIPVANHVAQSRNSVVRAAKELGILGQKPGRKISPERQAAIDATIEFLREAQGPVKTAG